MRHLSSKLLKFCSMFGRLYIVGHVLRAYLHALSTNQNSRLTRMFLYQIVSLVYVQPDFFSSSSCNPGTKMCVTMF